MLFVLYLGIVVLHDFILSFVLLMSFFLFGASYVAL